MAKRTATVRARGLGAELKELRGTTKLSTRAVAERVGWSASTVNRIENGSRTVTSEDVSALLVVYGVTGAERERLLGLAKEASRPGWWETGSPSLPSQLAALIRFEAEATRIVNFELVLIPGLLQTPGYARAIMECGQVPEGEVETRVVTRMGRQVVLSRAKPPKLLVIIDEAALHRPIGGRTVMAEQLRHVVSIAERPNVTVQVMPFSYGGHTALNGPFALLEFTKARPAVHLEHKGSMVMLDEPQHVEPYEHMVKCLQHESLDSNESSDLITRMAAEYEK